MSSRYIELLILIYFCGDPLGLLRFEMLKDMTEIYTLFSPFLFEGSFQSPNGGTECLILHWNMFEKNLGFTNNQVMGIDRE